VQGHPSDEQRNIPHLHVEVNREPPIGTPGHDLCVTGRCTDPAQSITTRGAFGIARITNRAKPIGGDVDSLGSFFCTDSQRRARPPPAHARRIGSPKEALPAAGQGVEMRALTDPTNARFFRCAGHAGSGRARSRASACAHAASMPRRTARPVASLHPAQGAR